MPRPIKTSADLPLVFHCMWDTSPASSTTPSTTTPHHHPHQNHHRCPHTFKTADELFIHLSEDHIGRKALGTLTLTCHWHHCPHPSRVFTKRDNLVSHCRSHVHFRANICRECGSQFKWPQDLKKHCTRNGHFYVEPESKGRPGPSPVFVVDDGGGGDGVLVRFGPSLTGGRQRTYQRLAAAASSSVSLLRRGGAVVGPGIATTRLSLEDLEKNVKKEEVGVVVSDKKVTLPGVDSIMARARLSHSIGGDKSYNGIGNNHNTLPVTSSGKKLDVSQDLSLPGHQYNRSPQYGSQFYNAQSPSRQPNLQQQQQQPEHVLYNQDTRPPTHPPYPHPHPAHYAWQEHHYHNRYAPGSIPDHHYTSHYSHPQAYTQHYSEPPPSHDYYGHQPPASHHQEHQFRYEPPLPMPQRDMPHRYTATSLPPPHPHSSQKQHQPQHHPPPPHVTTTPLTTTTNTSVITPSPSTVSPDSQKSIQNNVTSSMQTPQQEFLNDANNNHDSKDYRQLQHYDNHYYHHPHHPHHSYDQGHYYHHQQRHDYANHPRYENHHFGY